VNSGMRHRSDCRGALQVTVVTVTVLRYSALNNGVTLKSGTRLGYRVWGA